jgi:hypothetical protein
VTSFASHANSLGHTLILLKRFINTPHSPSSGSAACTPVFSFGSALASYFVAGVDISDKVS